MNMFLCFLIRYLSQASQILSKFRSRMSLTWHSVKSPKCWTGEANLKNVPEVPSCPKAHGWLGSSWAIIFFHYFTLCFQSRDLLKKPPMTLFFLDRSYHFWKNCWRRKGLMFSYFVPCQFWIHGHRRQNWLKFSLTVWRFFGDQKMSAPVFTILWNVSPQLHA